MILNLSSGILLILSVYFKYFSHLMLTRLMFAEIGRGIEDPFPGDFGEGEHERGAGIHNDGERD